MAFIAALICSACSITVNDQTPRQLYYSPPDNQQPFRARVETTGSISLQRVKVALDNGYTVSLNAMADDIWQGSATVAACEENIAYRYLVEYTQGSSEKVKTFPETGRYVRQVQSVDPSCSAITAAHTYLVNTTEDLADAAPGDGLCNTGGDPARCSLRAAVMEANARFGPDLILLPPGRYGLTRMGSTAETDAVALDAIGDLDITDSVAIVGTGSRTLGLHQILRQADSDYWQILAAPGPGESLDDPRSDSYIAKIDGAQRGRVVQVHPGPHYLVLENLTLTGGRVVDGPGAGLLNAATVRLDRVVIHDNKLVPGGGGGGVFSPNLGVGIHSTGDLAGKDVAIVHNTVGDTTGIAGGIWLADGAKLTLENALIALNQSRFAAGIYAHDETPFGGERTRLNLTNTTIAHNSNTGSVAHALVIDGAEAKLNFVTVARNNNGGLTSTGDASVRLSNSLLLENGATARDCSGRVITGFYNVVGTTSAACADTLGTTDTVSASPFELGDSLTYEGGFAHVLRLSPNDSGRYTALVDGVTGAIIAPAHDARGAPRKIDGREDGNLLYDPGAFEYSPR